MKTMKTTVTEAVLTPEVMAELQKIADDAARGIRDPEKMRQAFERMGRMREGTYRKHGWLDVGLLAICQLRDTG